MDFTISAQDLRYIRGQATLEEVAIIAASLEWQKRIAQELPEYAPATHCPVLPATQGGG